MFWFFGLLWILVFKLLAKSLDFIGYFLKINELVTLKSHVTGNEEMMVFSYHDVQFDSDS